MSCKIDGTDVLSNKSRIEPSNDATIENICLCQICFSNFNDSTKLARVLHCGHTFCTNCIETIKNYGNSAHLECPQCRVETKCPVGDIAPNFSFMEIIAKLGYKDTSPDDSTANKPACPAQSSRKRSRTPEELADEAYRKLIANVKGEIMHRFEDFKANNNNRSSKKVREDLQRLCESIASAVRDAPDEESMESEDDESSDCSINSSLEAPRGENEVSRRGTAISRLTRAVGNQFRRIFNRSEEFSVENPMNRSSSSTSSIETSSDIPFESCSSDEAESSTCVECTSESD